MLSPKRKIGRRLFLMYLIQVWLYLHVLPHITHPFIIYTVSFISDGSRQMMPSLLIGIYTLTTTRTEEWVALCKMWRLPRGVTILVAVVGRFYPTLKQDYHHIRESMAMRGIGSEWRDVVRHPLQTFEYIIVPLLINSTRIAQNLTIAALTKGLSLSRRQTSITRLEWTPFDWVSLGVGLILFTLVGIGGM